MYGSSLSTSIIATLLAFSVLSVEGGYVVLGLTMAAVLAVGTYLMAQNRKDLLHLAQQSGVVIEKKNGTSDGS